MENKSARAKVQAFGGFLTAMVIPNIGAFIAGSIGIIVTRHTVTRVIRGTYIYASSTFLGATVIETVCGSGV